MRARRPARFTSASRDEKVLIGLDPGARGVVGRTRPRVVVSDMAAFEVGFDFTAGGWAELPEMPHCTAWPPREPGKRACAAGLRIVSVR